MPKHTIESIQVLSNKKHNNNYIIISGQTYLNNKSKLKFYCKKCESIIEQRVDNHLHGTKCRICSYNESFLTINDIRNKVKDNFGYKYYIPEQEISGTKHKIKVFCNDCKKHFTIRLSSILQGYGCRNCKYNKIRLSLEEIRERSFKVHKNKYLIPKQEIKNNDSEITVFCKKCNSSYSVILHSFLQGYGCKKCAIKSRTHTIQDVQNKSKQVHGDIYVINTQDIQNSKSVINIWCKKCKKYFNQKISYHINSGCGCPFCKTSKGEKIIQNYLLDNNIEFYSQKRFKDCRDKLPLPFDFYLPEFNICIEFDGEQHFKEKSCWGGEESLIKTTSHDQIKTEYCKNQNIKLIRIKYSDNIKEKLLEFLVKRE